MKDNGYSTVADISSPEFTAYPLFNLGFDEFHATVDRNLQTDTFGLLNSLKDQKFFLWIALGTVHAPYGNVPFQMREDFLSNTSYKGFLLNSQLRVSNILQIYNRTFYPEVAATSGAGGTFKDFHTPPTNLTDADMQYIIDRYDLGLKYTDQYIGQVIQNISALGLDKDTIVIITSPHGEGFGEHGYVMHYDIYETETHAPLIIRIPGVGHRTVEDQVQSIDVLPTILDLVGIAKYQLAEGQSLAPLIEGQHFEDRPIFIERIPLWEQFSVAVIPNVSSYYEDFAVRTSEWKLIYRQSAAWENDRNNNWYSYITGLNITYPIYELYNIKTDPMEQNNLISQRPDIASQLNATLQNWITQRQPAFFNRTEAHPTAIFPYP